MRINACNNMAGIELVLLWEGKQAQIGARRVEIIAKGQLSLVVRRMLTAPLELSGLSIVALHIDIKSAFFAPELIAVQWTPISAKRRRRVSTPDPASRVGIQIALIGTLLHRSAPRPSFFPPSLYSPSLSPSSDSADRVYIART